MVTVDEESAQAPFVEIVQLITLSPTTRPATPETAELVSTKVSKPVDEDQLPIPIAGTPAFSNAVEPQTVSLLPAKELDGFASTTMLTVSTEVAQTPLLVLHAKTEV